MMNRLIKSHAVAFLALALFLAGCEKQEEQAPPANTPAPTATPAKATPTPKPRPKPAKANPADWPKDAVWYQIFPERFRNGDTTNDPTRESLEWPIAPSSKWHVMPWTADWYARADWEREIGPDFYKDGVLDRRYGGDLQGVLDSMDYLADLGINAIYFNPLFYANSLHKYDGNSYHHIDPYFGPDPAGDLAIIAKEDGGNPDTWKWTAADKLFLRVISEAHSRGIHVILDGVFNHTGRDSFAFKDLLKNQEQSKYKDWYVVESFDDPATKRNEFAYKGWWGYKSLPVFAASPDNDDIAQGPKDYIFAATKRWMAPDGDVKAGIDGWRLDVAPERPAKFWSDWNAYVRDINPIAYTSCEIWDNAAQLIENGKFSASMNYYAFAMPVKGFLVDDRIKAGDFGRLLNERRESLPKGSAEVMQNLMGSHDTDRLASMIVNSDIAGYSDPDKIDYNSNDAVHKSDNYKIRKPDDRERAIQRLVVLFQNTYVGAPMVYYGDEAGMWGASDPDNRMPMVWSDLKYDPQTIDPRGQARHPDAIAFDAALFKFYKSAIALRHEHEALRRGDFKIAGAFDDAQVFAFERTSDSENLLVVFNRSETEQTVHIDLKSDDVANFTKPSAIFSSDGNAAGIVPEVTGKSITVKLPALTGAVIAGQ